MVVQVVYGARNYVQETSGYSYSTDIKDLQIGDIVLVPPTPYSNEQEQEATVISLVSDYKGPLKSIVSRVRRRWEGRNEVVQGGNPYQWVIDWMQGERWSQRQDSITDQLNDVLPLVYAVGCYDAGEVIKRFIEQRGNG